MDRKFENSVKPHNNRLEAYRRLKEQISKKVIEICDIFTKFQAEEQPKLKKMPVFLKDAQSYCDFTKPFLIEIEKEIVRHLAVIEVKKQAKEAEVRKILTMFDADTIL
jgi:hypothetical protein